MRDASMVCRRDKSEYAGRRALPLLLVMAALQCRSIVALDPITSLGVAVGAFMAGAGFWDKISDGLHSSGVWQWAAESRVFLAADCSLRECCTTRDIPADVHALRSHLAKHVHGQHLLDMWLVDVVSSHVNNERPRKPLVISFHGTTGVGKNYVTRLLAESLYTRGLDSRFVHLFVGSMHFPLDDRYHVRQYADNLRRWIEGNLTVCSRSLFIFDEVDKIPAGVLDAIKPFMDYYERLHGSLLTRAIFVLLSNTGGKEINKIVLQHWKQDLPRQQLSLRSFEEAISEGAFRETGGLYRSNIISNSLIDFYLPFLPLQREHVRLCVRDEFLRLDRPVEKSKQIDEVLEMIRFDQKIGDFARSGCKDVANKVNLVIDRNLHG